MSHFVVRPIVLDALEQALWARGKPHGVTHHSDRGCQYLSIRYTEKLTEAGFKASVGSVGDSYDNALAETMNGLYKAEVIHKDGPWKGLDEVEHATLTWVDWFNHRRILNRLEISLPLSLKSGIMNRSQTKQHDSNKTASDKLGRIQEYLMTQRLIVLWSTKKPRSVINSSMSR